MIILRTQKLNGRPTIASEATCGNLRPVDAFQIVTFASPNNGLIKPESDGTFEC